MTHVVAGPRTVEAGVWAEERCVSLGARVLSAFEGETMAYQAKHYRALSIIERFKATFPSFRFYPYVAAEWKPRSVAAHGVPLELLLGDLRHPFPASGPWQDFVTLRPVRPQTLRRHLWEKAYPDGMAPSDAVGARLVRYLHGRAPALFGRMVTGNAEGALAAIITAFEGGALSEDTAVRHLMLARLTQAQPVPFYQPSKEARTVRVFGTAPWGLPLLPSLLRKAFCAGCIEFDLANAQLAFAARLWGLGQVKAVLGDSGSAWPYLLGLAGVRGDHVKAVLKRAVYGAVYGQARTNVRAYVTEKLGAEAADRILGDALMREVLYAARRERLRIQKMGFALDAFGHGHWLEPCEEPSVWARRTLACVMQSYELLLLEPVIDDAIHEDENARPLYQIVAWQHDGFTVKPRCQPEAVAKRLVGLVGERAGTLGFPTHLTYTYL